MKFKCTELTCKASMMCAFIHGAQKRNKSQRDMQRMSCSLCQVQLQLHSVCLLLCGAQRRLRHHLRIPPGGVWGSPRQLDREPAGSPFWLLVLLCALRSGSDRSWCHAYDPTYPPHKGMFAEQRISVWCALGVKIGTWQHRQVANPKKQSI